MPAEAHRIPGDALHRLHRAAFTDPTSILSLFQQIADRRVPLRAGINNQSERERALVTKVRADRLQLRLFNFSERQRKQVFFQFESGGSLFFFEAPTFARVDRKSLEIGVPSVVFRVERRGIDRHSFDSCPASAPAIELRSREPNTIRAVVTDWSYSGLGVEAPADVVPETLDRLEVQFLTGERAGEEAYGYVRNRRASSREPGWVRLGLSVSRVNCRHLIDVERYERSATALGVRDRASILAARFAVASRRMLQNTSPIPSVPGAVPLLEFRNRSGEAIRAIVDGWGNPQGAPLVLIPPAWGRTKETLLPLAATIVETFRRARQPIVVMRFDGIRRRGESYNDPECCVPGRENTRFTFSQGVRDIESVLDFVYESPKFRPSKVVLVTFSAAAVEGRRAAATDLAGRISAWISVVGMADPQSGLRTISGGVDYVYGLTRGVRFGLQEVLGVLVDIDHVGMDAIKHRMVFFEDVRREMDAIKLPVTWIHGRYDAWLEIHAVRELLSCGDTSQRRLIEVPTGHQLRSSKEALETFRLIAAEVSRFALGEELSPALPNLAALERRRVAERVRLPFVPVDLRSFWSDYLLGRDRRLGIELVTATDAYQELIAAQTRALALQGGERLADLGAGVGAFLEAFRRNAPAAHDVKVVEIDFVLEALQRARSRSPASGAAAQPRSHFLVANLDIQGAVAAIPIQPGSCDRVLASLLISYLSHPERLLAEVYRILRPGGRLVLSTMRRDGDISKIYLDGMREMQQGKARNAFGAAVAAEFDELSRPFVNDAAKILDLEESGQFRFWDRDELKSLVEKAGFVDVVTELSLGDPPQAVVLAARRP